MIYQITRRGSKRRLNQVVIQKMIGGLNTSHLSENGLKSMTDYRNELARNKNRINAKHYLSTVCANLLVIHFHFNNFWVQFIYGFRFYRKTIEEVNLVTKSSLPVWCHRNSNCGTLSVLDFVTPYGTYTTKSSLVRALTW